MIKPVPHRLAKRVTELGGIAPNGKPLFRVMRGCDRFTIMGGKWLKYDNSGNQIGSSVGMQEVLKYPQAKNRYIFEMLCPPENYGTPLQWQEQFTEWIDGQKIETLGPFPREGEYELISNMGVLEKVYKDQKTGKVLRTEFVELTETLCDAIVQTARLNRELPEIIRREAAKDCRAKEEQQKEQNLIDRINEMAPAFSDVIGRSKPHVVVPNLGDIAKYGN